MSATLADFNSAARLKEFVRKVARKVVLEIYAPPRKAYVIAVNHTTREYTLQYPGETETFVVIHQGAIVPQDDTATVRVAGVPGDRYIDEVFGPALFIGTVAA